MFSRQLRCSYFCYLDGGKYYTMDIKQVLSMDIGSGEEAKPLTFQLTLGVLLFIPCPILLLIGYRGQPSEYTTTIRLVGWGLILLGAAFTVWHFRATSSKRNVYPDVLKTIFEPKEIYEVNGVQFALLMFQWKTEIRIFAILQNIHDSIAKVQMDFALQFTKKGKQIALPALKRQIGAAEVKLARFIYPLSSGQMEHRHVKITPAVQTRITQKAQVRFARRQVFDTKMKPWLSILMLAGPLAVFGGGRFFTVPLKPAATQSQHRKASQWALGTLWSPSSPKTESEIVKLINSQVAPSQKS